MFIRIMFGFFDGISAAPFCATRIKVTKIKMITEHNENGEDAAAAHILLSIPLDVTI